MAPARRPAQRWSRCMLRLERDTDFAVAAPCRPLSALLRLLALGALLPVPGWRDSSRPAVGPRACACTAPGPPPAWPRRPPASPSPRPAHASRSARRRSAGSPAHVRNPHAVQLQPPNCMHANTFGGSGAWVMALQQQQSQPAPPCSRQIRRAGTRGARTGGGAQWARWAPGQASRARHRARLARSRVQGSVGVSPTPHLAVPPEAAALLLAPPPHLTRARAAAGGASARRAGGRVSAPRGHMQAALRADALRARRRAAP
jgi:hypothetical protein